MKNDSCPICGEYLKSNEYSLHRCNLNILRGIDAANTRAERGENNEEDDSLSLLISGGRSIREKLKVGFRLLNLNGDEEPIQL